MNLGAVQRSDRSSVDDPSTLERGLKVEGPDWRRKLLLVSVPAVLLIAGGSVAASAATQGTGPTTTTAGEATTPNRPNRVQPPSRPTLPTRPGLWTAVTRTPAIRSTTSSKAQSKPRFSVDVSRAGRGLTRSPGCPPGLRRVRGLRPPCPLRGCFERHPRTAPSTPKQVGAAEPNLRRRSASCLLSQGAPHGLTLCPNASRFSLVHTAVTPES